MVDTNQQVIEEARQRGDTLTSRELLLLIEQYHRPGGPGVGRELLEAYDAEVARDDVIPYQEGQLLETVERHLGDDESWVDEETYYPVGDDRVSTFPAAWHDELGDTTDLRAYVDVIGNAIGGSDTDSDSQRGRMGTGVPEGLLLEAARAVGGLDSETAKSRLEERRDAGELVEDADQHPNARVHLSEDTEAMRDGWLED